MPFPGNDHSKDIPGKDGWSVRDLEKISDVVKSPDKYGVDPNDTGDDGSKGCPLLILGFLLRVALTLGTIGFIIHNI